MFDTLTVVAYLLGNEPGHSSKLHLRAQFLEQPHALCVQSIQSPRIQWSGVPPEAGSLALIIKDAKSYYWVVYNLPVQTKELPFGANHEILSHDEGVNSFGKDNYHTWCSRTTVHPVKVELYALDKRFDARKPMTGETLEQKIKGHVLAKVVKLEHLETVKSVS